MTSDIKKYLKRFHDLTRDDLRIDFQIHTTATDGMHTADEICEQAIKLGLSAIAFTEHIRRESVYYPDFVRQISQLNKHHSIDIYWGVESKVIDDHGNLDITAEDMNRAQLILGSVHRMNVDGVLMHPREMGKEKTLTKELMLAYAMIERGQIDVLAHPLGMSLRIYQDFSSEDLDALIKRIADTDIAFELNAKYTNPEFFKVVIESCRRHNPIVSIGSDVHRLEELGRSQRMLEEIYA